MADQPQTLSAASDDEATRYTRRSILRSERMYGEGFQSPGHLAMMDRLCRRLDLVPGLRVLEVGSGLGGAAFYLAERHGATVVGLDIAPAMVEIATERARTRGLDDRVRFEVADIRSAALEPESFDLVWSRDCILYIPEKDRVWQAVAGCLRPGGRAFITDFCRRRGPGSSEFEDYLTRCSYHLLDLDAYAAAMTAAGLRVLACEDITEAFRQSLSEEQVQLAATREDFLRDFDEADYEYLMTRWDRKVRFCVEGDLKWGLFLAGKQTGG